MDRSRHHELIAQVLIEISAIAEDDAQIKPQGRLRNALSRGETDAAPPAIDLIPDRPPDMRTPGLKQLHRFVPCHRGDQVNSLPLKIGRIIESAWIQRPARTAQGRQKADHIALKKYSLRGPPSQSNQSGNSRR